MRGMYLNPKLELSLYVSRKYLAHRSPARGRVASSEAKPQARKSLCCCGSDGMTAPDTKADGFGISILKLPFFSPPSGK
jgi:hypothetical protein